MTDAQRQLLEEAASSLAAAEVLFSTGYPGYAASRAYYAMFYVAQAFLLTEGLSFSKHAGVIAAFGKHVALAGKVPVESHRWLIEGQEMRQAGDYLDSRSITPDQSRKQLDRAKQFLELAKEQIA